MFLCNFIFNYHKSSIFLFVRLNGFAWRNSTAVKISGIVRCMNPVRRLDRAKNAPL